MKIALITGGSRGLGRSAALSLADQGINLIITYKSNREAAEQVIKELSEKGVKAAPLQLDTENTASLDSFVEEFKSMLKDEFQAAHFDYLLNNAGVGHLSPLTEMKEEDFDRLYHIHLKSVYFLTQRLVPLMNKGGSILNVSSGLTRFSYPHYSAYASLKGAIEVFTRYLAVELGPKQIRANTIAPGAIETDFGGGQVRDNKELNQTIASHTPLGRVGKAEDIGPIMAEILAGKTQWINGQRIEASGGIHS